MIKPVKEFAGASSRCRANQDGHRTCIDAMYMSDHKARMPERDSSCSWMPLAFRSRTKALCGYEKRREKIGAALRSCDGKKVDGDRRSLRTGLRERRQESWCQVPEPAGIPRAAVDRPRAPDQAFRGLPEIETSRKLLRHAGLVTIVGRSLASVAEVNAINCNSRLQASLKS